MVSEVNSTLDVLKHHGSDDRAFELNSSQAAIWVDQTFLPDKPIYNTGQAVTICGPLDTARFIRAVKAVVRENDALRLCLMRHTSGVAQHVRDLAELAMGEIDFSHACDPTKAAQQWIDEAFWTVLPWSEFPLFRFALLRLGPEHYIWLQKYNHLIIDALARAQVSRRTAEIYKLLGSGSELPAPAASFAEARAEEDAYLASDEHPSDRAYWLGRFHTLPEPLVEGDRRRTERAKSGRPVRLRFTLTRACVQRMQAKAKGLDVTIYSVVVAFVYIALSRLYRKSDLVLGLPLANRFGAKWRDAIGLFSQVMPFRLEIPRTERLADALAAVRSSLKSDYAHRRFPPLELASLLQLARHGRAGLFDVMVNYVPADYSFDFEGSSVEVQTLSSGFIAPWALTLSDHGGSTDVDFAIDYDRGLIDAQEAQRLVRVLLYLFEHGLDYVKQPIGSVPLIDAAERAQLINRAQATTMALPQGDTLASLWAAQAARTPDAIAVVHGTQRVDYKTLHQQVLRIASRLMELGVGPDAIVAVALPRTIELIGAVLGIHKAGGAYLPLDLTYPRDRIAFMLSDANARVVITTQSIAPTLPQTEALILLVDDLDDQQVAETPQVAARPEHLAYLIYTSGSTGRPKGVGVEHRNAVNLVQWARP